MLQRRFTEPQFATKAALAGYKNYTGVQSIGAITFNDTSHVLSVASITYWFNGTKVIRSSAVTCDIDSYEALTDNTLYYFYFDDATGTLKCSDAPWVILNTVQVATVWWNGTNGAVQYEAHDYRRDRQWHTWAHDTIGMRYESGLTLTAPTAASDSTLQIESGTVHDEDLEHTVTQQTTPRIVYKASASVYTWANSNLPYAGTLGQVQFLDTDTYALANAGGSEYVCMWVYVTNDQDRKIYIIPSHVASAYNTIAQARAETQPSLGGLNLSPEMKLIYRFIFRGDGEFQEFNDYRLTSPLPSGGIASTTAGAVSFSPTGNVAATTVQTAIEELDNEKVAKAGDTMTGKLTLKDGTFAALAAGFSGASNTGWFRGSDGRIEYVIGGSTALQLYANQARWNGGTIASPGFSFADETSTGLAKASAGVIDAVISGNSILKFEASKMTAAKDVRGKDFVKTRNLTLTYTNGLLTRVVKTDGRTIDYTYTNGVLTSYTDSTNTWTLSYTNGNLTGITVS